MAGFRSWYGLTLLTATAVSCGGFQWRDGCWHEAGVRQLALASQIRGTWRCLRRVGSVGDAAPGPPSSEGRAGRAPHQPSRVKSPGFVLVGLVQQAFCFPKQNTLSVASLNKCHFWIVSVALQVRPTSTSRWVWKAALPRVLPSPSTLLARERRGNGRCSCSALAAALTSNEN